ncbi:MAG: hypothetical protein ABEJ70_06535 [Halobacteriaceae archaeon]
MTDDTDTTPGREEVAAAIREVRREGQKVAAIYAAVDGTAAALAAGVVVGVVTGADRVGVPPPGVAAALGVPVRSVTVATVAAVVVGLAVGLGEAAWLLHRPLVRRFEAANPDLHEALHTAAELLEDDADTPMARRLYRDVLAQLRDTSTAGMLDGRRLLGTVTAVVALAVASVFLTAGGVHLAAPTGGGPPGANAGGTGGGGSGSPVSDDEFTGLKDGEGILGEESNVTSGSENLTAEVETSPGTGSDRRSDRGAYGAPSGGGAGELPTAEAARGVGLEASGPDADLIREYNLRIRETEEGSR